MPGHRHERRRLAERHGRGRLLDPRPDLASYRLEVAGVRWIVTDEPFGQPDRPHLRADRRRRATRLGAGHELRRSAADVEQRERTVGDIELVRPAEERQRRLLVAVDDLRFGAGRRAHDRDERIPVRRVANGGRRSDADPTGVQGARPRAVSPEHRRRPRERRRIEESGRVHALTELRDEHVARELGGEVARRGPFLDDQQPAGVRPLIDRGDPGTLPGMHRLDPLGDPSPDHIVTAGEVVRVVRVQALDPAARAADPAPGLRRRQHRAPVSGRLGVRRVDGRAEAGIVVVPAVQLGDRAGGLQPGDGLRRGRAGEPRRRRERIAVRVERRVADHQRVAAGAPRDHGERGGGLASELPADGDQIDLAELGRHAPYLRLCSVARR